VAEQLRPLFEINLKAPNDTCHSAPGRGSMKKEASTSPRKMSIHLHWAWGFYT